MITPRQCILFLLAAAACLAARAQADGKYIYVPDSLQADVVRLLNGHSKVVDDDSSLDRDELVVYKGDTIPMVLKSINLGRSRFDRGLSNYLFIPKSTWSIGLTVSYGEISTDDLDLLGLLTDIDISGHMFSIKPYMKYFIRNNMSVGLKFGYSNSKGGIGSFKVDIDEDMNLNLHDIGYRAESYMAACTFTQYVGIARRGRFAVFNEIDLAFKSGNSEFTRPYGGELRTTYTTSMQAQLNFSPGVQVYVMKNAAFHVSFGVFGFYLTHERQREDDGPSGSRFASGANFRFNIFNIDFGLGVAF